MIFEIHMIFEIQLASKKKLIQEGLYKTGGWNLPFIWHLHLKLFRYDVICFQRDYLAHGSSYTAHRYKWFVNWSFFNWKFELSDFRFRKKKR